MGKREEKENDQHLETQECKDRLKTNKFRQKKMGKRERKENDQHLETQEGKDRLKK